MDITEQLTHESRIALAAAAEITRLRAEIAALRTVMIAAAEEIHAHWDAHCDADGYGPANLMRRLEEGIASEYGYTAGAFAALTQERDALRADNKHLRGEFEKAWPDAERYRWLKDHSKYTTVTPCIHGEAIGPSRMRWYHDSQQLHAFTLDAAIDAAIAERT